MGSFHLIFCAFLALIPTVLCNVPVIIWNTHGDEKVDNSEFSALQQISIGSLQAHYFDIHKPKNVILFQQDALSIEDLASHGSEMEHVRKYMSDSVHKLYVPNVAQASHLQRELVNQNYTVTNLQTGTGVSGLDLDRSIKNLVVVKLPSTVTNPSRSRALRKADEVIQSVVSKIGDMADFTIIFTGLKSSLDPSSGNVAPRTRIARSLNQIGREQEIPKNFHHSTNVAMYVRKNMTISPPGSNGEFYPLPEENSSDEASGNTEDNEQSIKVKYTDVSLGDQSFYIIWVEVFFVQKNNYYTLPRVELQFQQQRSSSNDKKTLNRVRATDDGIAVGKSYSCNDVIAFSEGTSLNDTNVYQLRMNGIQMQAFMADDVTSFGPSWDCVGFFSIGIWAALIVIFLSLIILAFGLFVLSDIKTMDRFDDPKGKSIMVPQTNE